MKFLKFYVIAPVLLVAFCAKAQKSSKSMNGTYSRFSVSGGAGSSNYTGDLIDKKVNFFTQTGFSFSAGLQYAITSKLAARLDVGMQRLQGSDRKTGGAHPDLRGLSFKSNNFDVAISAEYTILNLDKFPISPYVSAGVGMVMFNPYANTSAYGVRQHLQELGTEGQGLAGYGEKYATSALEFPLGVGLKYPINDQVSLSLEYNYRITRTDYLDDVSGRYPNKTLLDARNPLTANYTFRGSTGPYVNNAVRGNPDNNDGFSTTQLKLTFKLK